MKSTPQPKSRRRQRGSVAVYAAVTMLAIMVSALVAIELGRVYGANQQLQKMASLAALDAVREASRCSRTIAPTQAELLQRVNSSLERNGVLAEMQQIDVEPGVIRAEASTRRRFLEPADLEDATAVRVTLRREFPALLSGLLPRQTGLMIASATAEQPLSGSFEVGSGLAGLSGGLLNSALGGLIGVNLGVVDYTGLANVNVTLEQLATALDVEVNDLSDPLTLQATSPVLSETLRGLASSLSGTANSTVINLLNQLAAAASSSTGTTALENLLGSYDLTGAAAPVVNLLDLVFDLAASTRLDPGGTGAVIPLNLTNVTVNIPGVTTLAVGLKVLEAPRPGRGRPGDPSATATTAQVRLVIRTQVPLTVVNIPNLISAAPINLGIDVDVAKATALLERIDCPREGINNGEPRVAISAEPAVATVKVGTYTGAPAAFPNILNGSQPLVSLAVRVLGALSVTVNLSLTNPVTTTAGSGTSRPLPLLVTDFERSVSNSDVWIAEGAPPDAAVTGNPQTVGSTSVLQGAMSSLSASLTNNLVAGAPGQGTTVCVLFVCLPLGGILDGVLTPVKALLTPVLSSVGGLVDGLLDPLLSALGIKVGSATVIMQSVTTSQPDIVSTCRPDLPGSAARGCPTEI